MRRTLQVSGVACFVLASSCGGRLNAPTDAGTDALVDTFISNACTSSADCPSGTQCLYPITAGCSATRQCIPVPQGKCLGEQACACNGTNVTVCSGSPVPIASLAPCTDCSGTTLQCVQCDVSGYSVAQMGRPAMVVGACTATELQSFVNACFSAGATAAACSAWAKLDAGACGACLMPVLQTATSWGPFDCPTSSSQCRSNQAGCADIVLHSVAQEKDQGGPGSCGDAINAALGCEDYACAACTVPADNATCVKDVGGTGGLHVCKLYTDVEDSTTGPCAVLNGDAAPPALVSCFPSTDADNVNFVNIFCGTGP